MKSILALLTAVVVAATISGCYYDPGYSYVRSSAYRGDVYYGEAAPGYSNGYYDGTSGYYGDGYYGCCYSSGVSVGVTSGWYRPTYHGGGYAYGRGYDYRAYRRRHDGGYNRSRHYRDDDGRGRTDGHEHSRSHVRGSRSSSHRGRSQSHSRGHAGYSDSGHPAQGRSGHSEGAGVSRHHGVAHGDRYHRDH